MSRHIVLLIAFGPEVRAFLHSGLAKRLSERCRLTIVTANPGSGAFQSDNGFQVLPLPSAQERESSQRLRYWAAAAHDYWLQRNGREKWHHYLSASSATGPGRTSRAARFGCWDWSQRMVHGSTQAAARFIGTDPAWRDFFRTHSVDAILTSSFASARTLPALQTAKNVGVSSYVFCNSWKDIYAHPYVPVVPNRLVVWSKPVSEDLLAANPHLPRETVGVSPSLHLERFFRPHTILPRQQFCSLAGLDPARPIICYSAAAPAAVRNETEVIEVLLKATRDQRLPGSPQILVRMNPMEDGSRFALLAEAYPELRLQKPSWEWDKARDWCCPLAEDAELWVATVYHSAVNVSISSTVTTEFAAMGRSVVNICFDAGDVAVAESNRRFWDADFYREIRDSGVAVAANSAHELVDLVADALTHVEPSLPATVIQPSPVDQAIRVIEAETTG
jgi:hypothetical protein